jgi:hypothetical protein
LRDVLWLAGSEDAVRETAVNAALMSALAQMDLREIEALMRLRPSQPHDAASNLRYAGALREIGEIHEAYFEISNTVKRLRSLGSQRRQGIAESSREAWAFYLYADLLERNRAELRAFIAPRSVEDVYEELHERLDELETIRCDPRREMDRLARDLEVATEEARLVRLVSVANPIGPPTGVAADGTAVRGQHVVADAANTFVLLSEMVGVAIHHIRGGYPLALIAARLLAITNRQLAIDLLLRAGSPEDLPFAQTANRSPDSARTDQDRWLVAEVVFDKVHSRSDFDALVLILDRIAAPPPEVSRDFIRPLYLDRKVRLLQHLLAGLIEREDGALAKALAEDGFAIACKIAYSPVVAATRAGWSNCLSLFEAVLSRFPFTTLTAKEILTKLLDLPIPTEANDATAESWPDPIRLLVEAWYPKSQTRSVSKPVPDVAEVNAELRELGRTIAEAVKDELPDDHTLQSVLHDHRRRWRATIAVSGPKRRLIVERRLALIDGVMPEATHAAASVSTPGLVMRGKRAKIGDPTRERRRT